ncbi:MAG: alpha/beta fold hydrolase [Clostridia bacterium]|nr:alpha/beta fold hydrolase [Clostridia bacterium]
MKLIKDRFDYCAGSLAYRIYEPEGEIRAILQVSHGMCEYIGRYEGYAEYLTSHGIVLAGNDHPGHGESAASAEDLGYFAKTGGVELAVEGLRVMSEILIERYPGKPLILLGHSMGSFLCRLYLSAYAENLAGAIIMGTGGPDAPTGAGIALANLIALFKGGRHRSKLLRSIQQAGYLKRCGKGADRCAWLTRDSSVVEKYNNDKYCNYIFTVSGYRDLFSMLASVSTEEWAASVPTDLPILLISGEDDPVGGYGKGVLKVAGALTHKGARRLTTVLIPGARHEVLNETDREETYAVIDKWLTEVLEELPDGDLPADSGDENASGFFETFSEIEI